MRSFLVALGLLVASSGMAVAQEPPKLEECAGVYGALAKQQGTFKVENSLLGERYVNYARIDFDGRLTELARKMEQGITELRTAGEADLDDDYMKLVDAETEGNLDTDTVRSIVELSDSCDVEYGFNPSLGG